MTMKKTAILSLALLAALFLIPAGAQAQRIVSGSHTCRYIVPDTESFNQAAVKAVTRAQVEMIAEHFGTIVGSSTSLTIAESVTSVTYGETEVKGEWIETLSAPVIRKVVVNDHFALDVTVHGKIMEILSTPIDLKCQVLKNAPDLRFASEDFTHGDKMYLYFKTPVDGYLAVYMGDGKCANCLFPYNGFPAETMKVSADEEYILFSRTRPGKFDPFSFREYPLGCRADNEMEVVRLYVVFSPNKFTKASDSADGDLRSLPFEDFHSWLSKARRMDPEMNVISSDITIRRK